LPFVMKVSCRLMKRFGTDRLLYFLLALAAPVFGAYAEDGSAGWLRYAPLGQPESAPCRALPASAVLLDSGPAARSAADELARAIRSMCGREVAVVGRISGANAFVLGTTEEAQAAIPQWKPSRELGPEGFSLATIRVQGSAYLLIAGADTRGILYGTFRLLEKIAMQKDISSLQQSESPAAPIRWVNQWDNLDGSIERGYAGRSIFYDQGSVRADLRRASEYARLLASVGLNGCTINNVNSDLKMLTPEMVRQVARIADAFRPWGVRLSMAVDLSSPKVVGGLETFDPLDPRVSEWWRSTIDGIYSQIPDFAGFVVKADSEGRPGPSQYGRTPAEAANVLARALRPHHGVLLYRAFVYNHHLDWNDPKADRARAGYDIFSGLDGQFDDNVIIQVKHGPIDFQVREPVSPLIAALRKTNQAIELQITQEYTGQQRHLVFLVPMWKEVLDFDLRADGRPTPVKEIVAGKTFHRPLGGLAGVANVGLDSNWLAHPLAMANLYGFGRLAWNPDATAAQIADDWTRLTFGNNPTVATTISGMELASWHLYEGYTGPLGLGTLTDILGVHYGPGIESAERNGWGQWIRADHEGVGMDRTVATGTGYIGQYPPEVARVYESLDTCPDELLLFMHHVSYSFKLHSGKAVIQHIYDSHYAGAKGAADLVDQWKQLRGLIDEERFNKVLALQEYQAGHAVVWRDAVTIWFERMSGIPDGLSRVGHFPNRIEAEQMRLTGYTVVDVTPWETASSGKAVACNVPGPCTASAAIDRPDGFYDVAVQYFDFNQGASRFTLWLGSREVAHWQADNTLPTNKMNGHTSTRYVADRVPLHRGDILKVEGQPDDGEPAPIDYMELTPSKSQD
jgi:alpha-glucuronidase